jgi:tetratricopeptide (TPR) repeat protein
MKTFLKTIVIICLMINAVNAQAKDIGQQAIEAYQNGQFLLSMRLYKQKLYNAKNIFSKTMALDGLDIVFHEMHPLQVIEEIEIIFKEYPNKEEALLSAYAEAFMRLGDYRRAKEEVERTLLVTKDYEYTYERLVTNGLEKMQTKSKKEIIVKDAYPEFVEELYSNSLKYYKTWKKTKTPKMYHKALFYIDSAITIEPNRSDLWFLKGMILSETKTQLQYEFALTSFLQAIIIRPKNDPAQMMVAQTLFNLGRYEEAITRYKWIFKTYKKEAMDYVTLYPFAVSHMALNKKQELLTYIDETLEEYDKNNIDIWIIWAVIHKNYGDKKHAIEILKWLIDISEDNKKRSYLEFLVEKYEKGDKK